MQLQLSQGLQLDQGLHLEQKVSQYIELCHLLALPDEVISLVDQYATLNPRKVEEILCRKKEEMAQKKQCNSVDGKIQAVYSGFNVPTSGRSGNGGMIAAPDVKMLEGSIDDYTVKVTPDVTYVGKEYHKPEIIFSDHLQGKRIGMFMMQVESSEYPEVAKMLAGLRRFDSWKRESLIRAYTILGEEQREYFENFDKSRLNKFDLLDLTSRLGLHDSTVYRIFNNRYAELRSISGETKIVKPRDDLLVTNDELKRNLILPKINAVLGEEFAEGRGYSDREIESRLGGSKIARRTIQKYREQNEVPPSFERTRAYENRLVQEAYKLI